MSPNFGIKQQGLEKYKDQLTNVIGNRTMGGRLFAENSMEGGTGEGKYFKTDFKSLILRSRVPAKNHHIFVATHIAQKENVTSNFTRRNDSGDGETIMCAAANGLIVVATLGVAVAGLRLRCLKVNSVGWGFFLLLSPLWLGFIVVPICKALM